MFREGSWNKSVEDRLIDHGGRILALEENDYNTLDDRISELESDVSSLKSWRSNKGSAIANVSTTVTADSIAILGITVPTNSSYVALVSAHNGLRNKVNDILAALRAREIIAA